MLKYDLLKKYFHPTHYKLVNSKINTVEKSEAQIEENVEKNKNLDCIDISIQVKQFHMKIYGIKVYITNKSFKKNILIYGFLDNIVINFLHNNKYISSIKQHVTINALNLPYATGLCKSRLVSEYGW
jgi:pyoverdine/dityrosine biosynthesis protein Dit1